MYWANTKIWYLERVIWLVAGSMILLSVALAYFVTLAWLLLTLLVGVSLIVFSLTGFCIMANLLYKLGFRSQADTAGRK